MAKGGPYRFSRTSEARLATCDSRLQVVVRELIKLYDVTVLEGHRSPARQNELYQQGRTKPGKIITNIDGIRRLGMHNHNPSRAVDLVPFPIDWADRERFTHMAGIAFGIAHTHGIALRWGGDWNMDDDFGDGWDLPHLELA